MHDTAVVESIVSGDSGGLAAAYDEYGDLVYAYCRSMLGEPEETADAVQATFVNAAAHAWRLHYPSQLRPWLFAIARSQCTRGHGHPVPGVFDTGALSIALGTKTERALLRSAVDGLSESERDILTLLWHGLDVDEAALVLGLSRDDIYSHFSRARDQLEASVSALLICQSGHRECPELDHLLRDWDGKLTVRVRDDISRHIEGCDTCAQRGEQELRPSLRLSLTPGALLGAAEEARAAVRPAPPWLRDRLLWLVTTDDAEAEAEREAMGKGVGAFGNNGFPKARRPRRTWPATPARPRLILSTAGGLAAVAALVALITVLGASKPASHTNAGRASTGIMSVQSTGRPGGASPSARPSDSPSATARPRNRPPTAPGTVSPVTVTQAAIAPTLTDPNAPAAQSGAVAGTVVAGTVTVSPSSLAVAAPFPSTFTITARGAAVHWSVSLPGSAAGQLSLSPSSGTLTAGQSVTVSVKATTAANFKATLTVSPGGHPVALTVGLG
jgi:DNA-directed RNA polymerase specialized sigma24 family protein